MSHSWFVQPLSAELWRTAAAGHDRVGKPLPGGFRVYPELAAAGLWTTPSDLARFAIELQTAASGRGGRVLKPESARLMLTPERYSPAGLGLVPAGQDSTLRVVQRGRTAGYEMEMVAFVHRGQGAVVMTNGTNGGALAAEILNAIAKVYGWPEYLPAEKVVARVDPRVLDRYVGTFGNGDARVSVRKRGTKLFLGPAGREATELLPESVSDFFTAEGDAIYSFVFDETGAVNALTVRSRDGDTRWNRI
jgi:hypothetical protein